MARKLPIEYHSAVHQVVNRGHAQETILHDDRDRMLFPSAPGEASGKTQWLVPLLSNIVREGLTDLGWS